MAEIVMVKAKVQDGRVAFWERNRAHPRGEILIAGNNQAVQVVRTPAIDAALAEGRLVLTQVTPVDQRTPDPQTRKQAGSSPLAGLGLTPEQEQALTDAGLGDREKVAAASDEDLTAVKGVGKATVENVRKALAA